MLVIVADSDPLFRRFVAATLIGTAFEAKLSEHGEEAWTLVKSASPPVVILYSWSLSDLTGAQLCKRLRRLERARDRYTIATLGPGEGHAVAAPLEAGVDDVMRKPISAATLLSRLGLAARRCASPERAVGTVRDAVREAIATPLGGEVVVRQGNRVGRIYVASAGIVWASALGEPLRLDGILERAGITLDAGAAAAIIEECRREKMHFADVLVRWGYLDEAGARECVRGLIAEQLGHLLALEDATALFLPRTRAYEGGVAFPLAQVASPTEAPPVDSTRGGEPLALPARDGLARHAEWARAALELEGATSSAVFDRRSSVQWAHAGLDIDGALAWSLLETLDALGPDAQEVLAAREGTSFVGRVLDKESVLLVGFDLGRTTLGLGRSSIAALISRRGEPREPPG